MRLKISLPDIPNRRKMPRQNVVSCYGFNLNKLPYRTKYIDLYKLTFAINKLLPFYHQIDAIHR